VLCHAFLLDMEPSVLLFHPGHTRLRCLSPRNWACSAQRQLSCQTLLLPLRNPPGICLRGRSGGVSKCMGSSRTRQAAAPYLRMMGSSSHSESRRDRSKSDTRERRACGSPEYVLGAGDPSHLSCAEVLSRGICRRYATTGGVRAW